jgi:hypothetical protein
MPLAFVRLYHAIYYAQSPMFYADNAKKYQALIVFRRNFDNDFRKHIDLTVWQ